MKRTITAAAASVIAAATFVGFAFANPMEAQIKVFRQAAQACVDKLGKTRDGRPKCVLTLDSTVSCLTDYRSQGRDCVTEGNLAVADGVREGTLKSIPRKK